MLSLLTSIIIQKIAVYDAFWDLGNMLFGPRIASWRTFLDHMILVSLSQRRSRYENFWRTSDIMRAKKPHSFDGFSQRWRYNVIEDLCLRVSGLSILQLRALLKLISMYVRVCYQYVRTCVSICRSMQNACMSVQCVCMYNVYVCAADNLPC